MIDPFENKSSKESITFNFIDVERRVIIDSLNMLNNTGKCFIQAVNFTDRVFLIQRDHDGQKTQKMMIFEYCRNSGQLNFILEELDAKKVKPVCFGLGQRLYVILVGNKSIAYDFIDKKKIQFTSLNFSIPNTNDLKSIVLNERDLFIFQSSKWSSKNKN